ncbi:AraC family transcriptional regulator [Actinacidiphila guanduensis]|uniref:HTH-type transcriptional regulator RipA n=1 Tax=Actinacidiphila guanduensis TaxID=310781 RepID=A0A1G9WFN4_9ACTN|nr:helix-turn-helix transcriptional regulator [Actinacidiphila guanduensis]SDM83290.1 AraC-type DNA-binding protein [Actinacidiphila guanduensis]
MPIFRQQAGEQTHDLEHRERTPVHRHGQGHLIYPARGVLSASASGRTWIIPANRTAWIPAHFDHYHRAHGRTDMRIVFVTAALAVQLPDRPAVLSTTSLAREALLALTAPDPAPRSPQARDRLRHVVVDELGPAPEEPLHLPEPQDPRLRELARIMGEDPAGKATLGELGRAIGVGERTLSRLCREELGMGFTRWRTQLRVHHALVLLTTGAGVLETAHACGWSNPSTFIDSFTALVGQTPGRYRRNLPPP